MHPTQALARQHAVPCISPYRMHLPIQDATEMSAYHLFHAGDARATTMQLPKGE